MGFFKLNKQPCGICEKDINLNTDDYCILDDFNKGKHFMKKYYHTPCYNKQIVGVNPDQIKMKKMALQLLSNAQSLFDKATIEEDEHYDL